MAADVAEMQASTIPMVVSSTNGGGGGGGGGAAKGHIASMDTIEKMLEFHVALGRSGAASSTSDLFQCTPRGW